MARNLISSCHSPLHGIIISRQFIKPLSRLTIYSCNSKMLHDAGIPWHKGKDQISY